MATVFKATDLDTGTIVAIKVPHPEMESDPVMYDRFKREEDIGTRMDHPGVMKVLPNQPVGRRSTSSWSGFPAACSAPSSTKKRSCPLARAVHLTIGICEALEYIHTHGVAHRDMKPENVMVDENDNIRLIDFGIAANAGSRRLTFANFSQGMGTPDYISPEQVRGKRGDARSDIYALGVMLYEMLTGRVPFTGPNPFAVMNDRLLNQPIPPRELEPSITPQIQEILYRALGTRPEEPLRQRPRVRPRPPPPGRGRPRPPHRRSQLASAPIPNAPPHPLLRWSSDAPGSHPPPTLPGLPQALIPCACLGRHLPAKPHGESRASQTLQALTTKIHQIAP